jgi:cell wall-associated NlpC family hydrolase
MNKKEKIKERLISFATKQLGKPYKYGAKTTKNPKNFDCSSFVQYIYKKIGMNLPRTTIEQVYCGKNIHPKKDNLQTGDLIFFKGTVGRYNPEFPEGIGHVVMYIGNGKIMQAKYRKNKDGSDGGKVQVDNVLKVLKRKDLRVIKRII